MEKKERNINFNEQKEEYDSKTGEMIPVWQSPKYLESKKKAIEMIESEKYNLSEADFWILKNKTNTGKMAYTGLIISHNGCLKINDTLENKVNPRNFIIDKEGYANSLVFTYIDDEVYEVGEFNNANGKNAYPYAMAFKRCFDRVVLKKSKLAYSGIYSEVEADEFKGNIEGQAKLELMVKLGQLIEEKGADREKVLQYYKVTSDSEMTIEQLNKAIEDVSKLKEKK